MTGYILAIDQGTTSTRAMVFDETLGVKGVSQQEFPQYFPSSGWVEHDPEDLWRTTVETCRAAVAAADLSMADIAAAGITNQRETTVLWDRKTGAPIHNAIVWQDRRTAAICDRLRAQDGLEADVRDKTGLLIDAYFSATKAAWILDAVDGARERAARGEVLFGTVDTYLIWRLTGGARHVTDATNAARTMLYDIKAGHWDSDLCEAVGVPIAVLPEVLDSAADFGVTDPGVLGAAIPILGVAGDQQAATVGQACFQPGMIKSTYGTGCFAVLNTGATPVTSTNRLLTTIAYQLNGKPTYALEASIFVAGAVVQWLRDGLGVISDATETQTMAERADADSGVYIVPAFVGLGAPHWDPDCRGAIFGLTRATGPDDLARAALESVGYQTRDLMEAMRGDFPGLSTSDTVLRVDGGMTASDWTMQFLADILAAPVDRPQILETTALGAGYLAGMHAGLCPDPASFAASWSLDRRFEPTMSNDRRAKKYVGWSDAVRRTKTRSAGT
jgi:glycerol kinase